MPSETRFHLGIVAGVPPPVLNLSGSTGLQQSLLSMSDSRRNPSTSVLCHLVGHSVVRGRGCLADPYSEDRLRQMAENPVPEFVCAITAVANDSTMKTFIWGSTPIMRYTRSAVSESTSRVPARHYGGAGTRLSPIGTTALTCPSET